MTLTNRCRRSVGLFGFVLLYGSVAAADERTGQVDFDRDVRPILSDRCFACHGPDAQRRQADLRLDTSESVFASLGDSMWIVRPGDLERSELYQRISVEDDDLRMPPVDSKLALNDQEKNVLRRWIEQGAPWKQHWAFQPITAPDVPPVSHQQWPRNAIDYFVLAKLEQQQLQPTKEAERSQLLRRLTFDLTGLPPTPEELDAFLADPEPDAYERQVDRLLASPRFGERMAVDWLDVARYADTYGYQSDVYRAMWPWRDWVVKAWNENLPFDQFVTWQLAGDLLPNPTQEQVLATAFNRHHRQTNEGGSVEEEFRVEYVSDRVNTFGTALLGLTLECARCHDHKFDPITQEEYYRLSAFFNSIDESGLYSHFTDAIPTPTLLLPDDQQRAAEADLQDRIEAAEQQLRSVAEQRDAEFAAWLQAGPHAVDLPGLMGDYSLDEIADGTVANRVDPQQPGKLLDGPELVPGKLGSGLKLNGDNTISVPAGGNFARDDAFSVALWISTPDEKERAVVLHRSRAWTDAGSCGYQLLIEEGHLSASLIHFWPGNAICVRMQDKLPVGRWVHVVMAYDGSSRAAGLSLFVDGLVVPCDIVRDNLVKNITGGGATTLDIGQRFRDRGFKDGLVDELKVYRRCLTPIEAAQLYDDNSLAQLLTKPVEQLEVGERAALYAYYLANIDPLYAQQRDALQQLRRDRSALIDPIPEIMVMRELPKPRPTYLLKRGAYDARQQQVEAGTPGCLPPWPDGAPHNRLGLAQWLTSPGHPLLARVTVNRLWQSLLGHGLVETAEDLGSQGSAPSHPELLDWLSRRFVDSSWNAKELIKLIVMSATYRQDSTCSAELLMADPENVYLARGPRRRLPAEMIRDNALFAGGLLVEKRGGPPVKPYEPEGLWKEKSGQDYVRDEGEGSHRRSLYTFWKRTSPPPAMMILDAVTREVCIARRQATATPLQALVLWNDPQFVEAARALAQQTMQQFPGDRDQQLSTLFRVLTSRRPDADELSVLQRFGDAQRQFFQRSPEDSLKLLAIGDHRRDEQLDPVELAALTAVAEALLSYDETITNR